MNEHPRKLHLLRDAMARRKATEKETPQHTLEKRFKIQEDTFAREKIDAFRRGVEKVRAQYPEITGATAYGSLVRGEGTDRSDVDGVVFIDLSAAIGTILKNAPEKHHNEYYKLGTMPPSFNSRNALMMQIFEDSTDEEAAEAHYFKGSNMEAFYKKLIKQAAAEEMRTILKKKREETGEDVRLPHSLDTEFTVAAMSTDAIDAVVDEMLRPDGRSLGRWYTPARSTARGRHRPSLELSAFGRNMGVLFHLDLGGGVRTYRRHLLSRLEGAGEAGETMWTEIRNYLEKWETSGGQRAIHVPETLADAVRVYGSEQHAPESWDSRDWDRDQAPQK